MYTVARDVEDEVESDMLFEYGYGESGKKRGDE
jgi:hypothetical protein